jgi:hypothetical protein
LRGFANDWLSGEPGRQNIGALVYGSGGEAMACEWMDEDFSAGC